LTKKLFAVDSAVEVPSRHKVRVAEVKDEVVRSRIFGRSEAHDIKPTR